MWRWSHHYQNSRKKTCIRNEDFFAREAKYHITCQLRYSVSTKWQNDNILSKQHQSEMEEVHADCFAKLCEVIDREIYIGKKVMKMTDLCSWYSTYLSGTPLANPNYRSEKIKSISNSHEVHSNKFCFVSRGKICGQY